ncbi:hypothetical protein QVD17_02560 [Tagetes erecta]|uniref:DUF1985 domain-containing protein n=1 Tax=Tagetes erecta TaxID=13708 RepID=A0AAD8LBY2_TARER|nr:hypothetical protein QVD17_02560 [Tagetes erecta]
MVNNTEETVSGTNKELYFDAEVTIKCQIAVAQDIRVRLRPGSARSELFRATCFGPWLDVQSTSNDQSLVHLMLQTQYIPDGLQNTLYFRVGGQKLRFGPQEFCLITGLRLGSYHWGWGRGNMTFKDRVFGVQARLKVLDLKNIFDRSLDQLSDLDAVRICLLMLLEVGFMGHESGYLVDSALLQLVEDLDSWNTFPWGSYLWKVVYEQLHNALEKNSTQLASVAGTKKLNYSLDGFIWAFKIWIFEVFPYARTFARKNVGIPRAVSWGKNQCITWKLALPIVMDGRVPPGFEPVPVLTPTHAERATYWWKASCRFIDFANDSSPPLKKARISSQPQSSVKVHEQMGNDIAITADTMPSYDSTTSHQTMERMANIEKQMLEIKDLWKTRRSHCVKKDVSTATNLVVLSDDEEDHVEEKKVSSKSDMICVQGYTVKQSVAPILESIFKKHGDIAAECVFKPTHMRSSFLETVCDVVSQIQTNDDIEEMEAIEQQLLATEAANINVSWLRTHLETIRKMKEEGRKCNSLMEVKTNTGLVKVAAQMDLRARCVELVAAQERVEEAKRRVRVLHLVEKNLNDNIFDCQAKIESWAGQQVL